MCSLVSVLLFILSANLDNIAIGIAYGIKDIKIGLKSNLLIAFLTTCGTLLSMSIGKVIITFLPGDLSNKLGASIIIILGFYFLIESIMKLIIHQKTCEVSLKNLDELIDYAKESDKDNSGDIDLKEALYIAIGLLVNNLGVGLAASVTGLNLITTAIFTFIFSLLFLPLGIYIGNRVLGKIMGKYSPLISGVLLIILGLIEWF